ncbi:recombinase family protein [Humitalea sp. 24SJ18S-53]|uniref:recombinase family protein n=1 Tax=Humitalea sp. 24SJ18S-53 TaxID=3422307 RepID=UPI003D67DCEA
MAASSDTPRSFVAYLRVSTDRQGRSGLGLEAQRAAIDAFVKAPDRLLLPPFVEVESGRKTDRPQLGAALDRCRRVGATLLVAKVDRLARNLPFLRSLIDGGVDVAFCDLPNLPAGGMGRYMLSQMALFAELERDMIADRTKAALAAAKARGVKLGGDRGYRPPSPPDAKAGGDASGASRSLAADHAAFRLMPVVEEIRAAGAVSLRDLASALTSRGIPTPTGKGGWTATAVRRVVERAARAAA